MKRFELEHLIRAAGSIANSREIIIIGSQAILGSFPSPPNELTVSMEADMYPADDPRKADLIDGSIGERSPFHTTFGYYAHGIGPETATLPSGWRSRLVKVKNENTNDIAGLCLSPADLAISKLIAGRPKDFDFVRAIFRHSLLEPARAQALLPELDAATSQLVRPRLDACAAQ